MVLLGAGLVAMPQSLKEKIPFVSLKNYLLSKNIHYGLDLTGGSQLDFVIDMSRVDARIAAGEDIKRKDIIDGVIATLRRRIDPDGTREINIFSADFDGEEHLFVELPADADTPEIREKIQKNIDLQFKEPKSAPDDAEKTAAKKIADDLLKKLTPENFAEMAKKSEKKTDTLQISFLENRAFFKDQLPKNVAEKIWDAESGIFPEIIESEAVAIDSSGKLVRHPSFSIFKIKGKKDAPKKVSVPGEDFSAVAKEIFDGNEKIYPIKNLPEKIKKDILKTTAPGKISDIFEIDGKFKFFKLLPATEKSGGVRVSEISADSREKAEKLKKRVSETTTEKTEPQILFDEIKIEAIPNQWADTGLDGRFFKTAKVGRDRLGKPVVVVQFNREGAEKFQKLTKKLVGKPMAIFVGGKLISAPIIQEEIAGGAAQITLGSGNFLQLQKAAGKLANDLNAGATPAPVILSGELRVAPSLGKNALEISVKAGIIGLFLLAIFMIFQYRLLGMVAVFSLGFYAALLFFLLKFLPFFIFPPIVLTLAGIAGMLLSIGMAVDANVLIFERLGEELRAGRTFAAAVSVGFDRAWTSIRDANLTTLLVTTILILLGTSIIKAFAIMLSIGVILSMFTAIVVTRAILSLFIGRNISKKIGLFTRQK